MSNLPCLYLHAPKKRGPKAQAETHPTLGDTRSQSAQSGTSLSHDGSTVLFSPSIETRLRLDQGDSTSQECATPPWMVSTPQSSTSQWSTSINFAIQALHQDLVMSLESCVPHLSMKQIVASCIDVHRNNFLSFAPQVNEPSLLSAQAFEPPSLVAGATASSPDGAFHGPSGTLELNRLRSYTLTTAVCAGAAYMLPSEIVSNRTQVGQPFLRASRGMLNLYHDVDIEHPNSSSLNIRLFQAGALHTDGKDRLAWQLLGEATRLAEQMLLYDERSYEGLDSSEACMRRNAFWHLWLLDKFAALVDNRPMTLHEFYLNRPVTTKLYEASDLRLRDPRSNTYSPEFEEQLRPGFSICQRMWGYASDLFLNLQMLSRFCRCVDNAQIFEEAQRMDLTATYLSFASVLDNLPPYLQYPESTKYANESMTAYHRQHFWVQRTNLLVTYHCLKMILLQRFADLGLASLLGLSVEGVMLAMRKTEVAHELVNVITSVPFDSLRANGEACIAKIRRVGATLLEIINEADAPQIASRAKSLFSLLLDVLSKLDSRASDELNKEYIK